MDEEHLVKACLKIVPQVLVERNWGLVQEWDCFMAKVVREAQKRLKQRKSHSRKKLIEQATINCYNHIWYKACCSSDSYRQQQAFTELYEYLFPIALYRANHDRYIAEESTQEALIIVWKKLNNVRDSGALARYAGMIVSREVGRRLKKTLKRAEITETDLQHTNDLEGITLDTWSNFQAPTYTEQIDIQLTLEQVIKHCIKRSKQQREVMIRRFLHKQDTNQIANELGMTRQNVYGLIHKARKNLRKCSKYRELMEMYGLSEVSSRNK